MLEAELFNIFCMVEAEYFHIFCLVEAEKSFGFMGFEKGVKVPRYAA